MRWAMRFPRVKRCCSTRNCANPPALCRRTTARRAAQIASTLQSGSGNRALELTGLLFTCMRRRRVHESECRPVLQRLQILMASHLTREQLLRAPAMLLPQQGYALEEVRLSVERLEGYILQCQAQQNDTPAAPLRSSGRRVYQ